MQASFTLLLTPAYTATDKHRVLQVEDLTQQLTRVDQPAADSGTAQETGSRSGGAASSDGGSSGGLRGLQDVRGEWRGAVQAYGGGGGATSVDFDLKGQAWEWGDYGLDQVR